MAGRVVAIALGVALLVGLAGEPVAAGTPLPLSGPPAADRQRDRPFHAGRFGVEFQAVGREPQDTKLIGVWQSKGTPQDAGTLNAVVGWSKHTGTHGKRAFHIAIKLTGQRGSFVLSGPGVASAPVGTQRAVRMTLVLSQGSEAYAGTCFTATAQGNIDNDAKIDFWSISSDSRKLGPCDAGKVGGGEPENELNDVNN